MVGSTKLSNTSFEHTDPGGLDGGLFLTRVFTAFRIGVGVAGAGLPGCVITVPCVGATGCGGIGYTVGRCTGGPVGKLGGCCTVDVAGGAI